MENLVEVMENEQEGGLNLQMQQMARKWQGARDAKERKDTQRTGLNGIGTSKQRMRSRLMDELRRYTGG
jgi:hypothetical protein